MVDMLIHENRDSAPNVGVAKIRNLARARIRALGSADVTPGSRRAHAGVTLRSYRGHAEVKLKSRRSHAEVKLRTR